MPDQPTSKPETIKLPHNLTMPAGATITMEELVARLALLRSVLEKHLEFAGNNTNREPLSYPEAYALYDIASTAYYALAGTLYADEINRAKADGRPCFI